MAGICSGYSRARDHCVIANQVEQLQRENPAATRAEIYDTLITAGYDLDKARRMIGEARSCAMCLGDYLSLFETSEVRE